jgi:hypothetical protein
LLIVLQWSYPACGAGLEDILKTCAKVGGHVDQRECEERIAASSDINLKSAESALLNRILTEEEPDYVPDMTKALKAGNASVEKYRENECELYAALTQGGNGAGDLRLACVIALNSRRTEQLEWAAKYFWTNKADSIIQLPLSPRSIP